MSRNGLLMVISGPSGSGKGTIIGEYLKNAGSTFLSVSATTRHPREGEVDGKNYHFLTEEAFQEKIDNHDMLEWARYCDHYYGTPKSPVEEHLANGDDVILEIDVVGAMNIKRQHPEGVYIFVLPPSLEVLKKRLSARGTETEDVVAQRLKVARGEIAKAGNYDYLVTNGALEEAVDQLRAIVWAEKSKMSRKAEMIDEVFINDSISNS